MFRTVGMRVAPEVMRLILFDAVPVGCTLGVNRKLVRQTGERLQVAVVRAGVSSATITCGVGDT